jgi:hypothetical protein
MTHTNAASRKRSVLGVLSFVLATLFSSLAFGQIKAPGAHPHYDVEIEPHIVLQWDHEPWDDSGFGPGVRVNIPFLDNGPIDRINNNMAIGFGFDWAHFSGDCNYGFGVFNNVYNVDCTGNVFMAPVTLQWNFFLTPRISVFGEPGIAIAHSTRKAEFSCSGPVCPCANGTCSDSDTHVWGVFWGGARFLLSDSIAFTARVGTPYVSLGASFLM